MNSFSLEFLKKLQETGFDLNKIDEISKLFTINTVEPVPQQTTAPVPQPIAEPVPQQTAEPVPQQTAEPVPQQTTAPAPPQTTAPAPQLIAEPETNYNKLILESITKLTETLQASNRLNSQQPPSQAANLESIANYIINGEDEK